FFWQAPHGPAASGMTGYQGFFYHFLDMSNGHRFKDVELSTVDTSLLLAGVLFCQSYFDGANPDETSIRAYADSLYQNADWNWASPRAPLIGMGWTPEQGFGTYDWRGYDEAMLVYILALGSPTHPIAPEGWNAWTSTYQWGSFHGLDQVGFAPLFGHQFSHIWIDFRGIQDEYMRGHGIDYFENSRRATLSQHDYAIENPMGWQAYGDSLWGLSASDGPSDSTLMIDGRPRQFFTYAARGAAQTEVRDDGTIAPTALGGSLPFAPSITLATLISMRHRYGDALFSTYGFFDALNPSFPASSPPAMGRMYPGLGWVDTDYLGIDQGPIIAMAENYRTGLIWRYMRKNPNIIRGLQRAGFQGGWLTQAGVTP
ncbi:MAG: glucoamylase family protein, partial [Gemmatimonadota bacterium]